MLPVNYAHFEKIYLITQEDDVQTIEFCKQFDNVTLLYYDFKNNNKKFDKFGALNYAQNIVYQNHPTSWYLIIDSDIILPNNFINILSAENLNQDCIYGAHRINIARVSELLNKNQFVIKDMKNEWIFNNIVHWKNCPPSILGCFQLYKKKVYHRNDLNNAGYGDYYFGHDNFNLFCNLDSVICFHLGEAGQNWDGKIVSFVHDIDIPLSNVYYTCNKKCNTIYYDSTCKIVKYGNTKNIDDDVWTCSDQMRYDIYDFFKHNPEYKIAEIGAHKGYTTKILANIFLEVYAVDNSIEWTEFSKQLNKDADNIHYEMLDIYKNSWEQLPEDIDVSFIDAMHSYEACKSDVLNSIKQFKNLEINLMV